MLAGGAVHTFGAAAERSNQRWWLVRAAGMLSVVAGVLALVWPEATIVVLAVLLGVRTLVLGVVKIAFGLSLRRIQGELPSQSNNQETPMLTSCTRLPSRPATAGEPGHLHRDTGGRSWDAIRFRGHIGEARGQRAHEHKRA